MLVNFKTLKPFAWYLVALVASVTLIDRAVWVSARESELLTEATEINSPATVYAKVDALRVFQGLKVAVLGDSLVYGRSLQEHGIDSWQKKNLTAALKDELTVSRPSDKTMVMNFGMNGITPSELENLVPLVMSAKPDLIVMDVTLRSFSRDFDNPGSSPRTWLTTMSIDPSSGTLSLRDTATPFDSSVSALMIEHYFLYRVREIVQFKLFEARPKEFFTALRDRTNAVLRGVSSSTAAPDEFMLRLKAQQRYSKVDLKGDNSQWLAYLRVLQAMKLANQKALMFYATENPDIRESLVDEGTYQKMIHKLSSASQAHNTHQFVGPLTELTPAHFLDHVHLTPSGYHILAKQLADRAVALIYAN